MITFGVQLVLMFGYLILLGAILYESNTYEKILVSLNLKNGGASNSILAANWLNSARDIGVSGSKLYELFESNLVGTPATKQTDISLLYDTFYDYIFYTDPGQGCSLENSAVSRLTRDVTPLPLHSHNDYWRDVPLLKGLAYGAISTEADVWLFPHKDTKYNEDVDNLDDYVLAVGHDEDYIDPIARTMDKLYSDPLFKLLESVNCHMTDKTHRKNGVFFTANHLPLYVYIDFKSDDNVLTYKLLMERYLKGLIDKGYMTYYDLEKKTLVEGPLKIIMTGNYPTDPAILDNGNENGYYKDNKRYLFIDSHLLQLSEDSQEIAVTATASLSQLLATVNSSNLKVILRGHLNDVELKAIKGYIDKAHKLDLRTRIWGIPSWPRKMMHTLWEQQINDLHTDLLNVDDLKGASEM